MSTVAPVKERKFDSTGEVYVTIVKGETTYYVVFDAIPAAGPDGRTSKYLCAIDISAEGYDEAEALAGIEGYKFDFFFGQDKVLQGYTVKAGDADLGVDATVFLRAVASWESSASAEGTLGYVDGEIIFVNTKEEDDYGRTSGLRLNTEAPVKERTSDSTGEVYVSIVKGDTTYYVVFDAEPKAGADGRTSKYLCAIPESASGYDEAASLANIANYKFDFFFGQDKALEGYSVKAGEAVLSVDATVFLKAVAVWESAEGEGEGALGYADGGIVFVNTKEKDDYGRTSGLRLSTEAPVKERTSDSTGEVYVSIVKGDTTYYVVFDAEPKAGADGRTSKYLCAIPESASGYDEAASLANIANYKFDFFFGQDPTTL